MSGQIQWDAGATGVTSYAILRDSLGNVYNLLSGQFETSGFFSGSYSGAYPISGTEQGMTAYFTAPFPSGIVPGYYNLVAKQQAGVFPVQTDVSLANGNVWWTGSGIQTFPSAFNVLSITPITGLVSITSGANVVVPPSSLSGLVANSGLFVSVPISTISGAVANSGLFVSVPISTLSGVQPISGATVSVPISSISGVNAVVNNASLSGTTVNANVILWQGIPPNSLISSGRLDAAFNVLTGVAVSGTANTIQFASGSVPLGISGTLDNQVITIVGNTGVMRSRTIQNMGSSGIAFLFPSWDASGVAASGSIFTITPGSQTFSGGVYPASGANTVVPSSTLSGIVANSGLFVSVPTATLSGVVISISQAAVSGIFSGNFVVVGSVLSGVFSGQQVTLTSGQSYTASGIWPASGAFVNATATIASGALSGQIVSLLSGQVWLASGSVTSGVISSGIFVTATATIASGALSGQQVTLVSGQSWFASGQSVLVYSGQLSGQNVTPSSGTDWLPSGSIFATTFASGVLAQSGQIFLASGTSLFYSGFYYLASGQSVNIYSGQLSGQPIAGLSGFIYPASGVNVTATATIASGALSGQQVTLVSGQSYIASGVNTVVPPSSLSGVTANSGLFVTVPIASISGTTITLISGTTFLASGSITSGVISSGIWVNSTATITSGAFVSVLSGTTFLASGSITSGVINSGIFVTATAVIASGALSGQQVTLTSGQSYIASGINSVVPPSSLSGITANSGLFVTVPIASISGAVANSGLFVTVPISSISGLTANSGLFVNVPISTISGVQPVSGTTVSVPIASISGTNAVVPISTLSGIQPISGTFVSVPPSSLSGVIANSGLFVTATAVIASGALSGQLVGLLSGQLVNIYSGQLSGQQVTLTSGQSFTASGIFASVPNASVQSGQIWLASGWPQQLLTTDFSGLPVTPPHMLINAARKLTNKLDTGATLSGFLTVFQENTTSVAYQQALGSQSGATPITSIGDA